MKLKVNSKLKPLLVKPKPIKIAIGGRGSGKSIGFGDIFTFKMHTEKSDIYCLREFQDSVTDSVHRVFKGSIQDRLKLSGWDIQQNRIIAPNGAQTAYKGANRNPDAMQSAQGYKYSWFEEAHRASQASLDKLLPTILRNTGAECWFSANPQSSADPFSQRFINPYKAELDQHGYYEDDLHIIVVVNWRDNPWWNEEQEALRSWDYENLSRSKYDWIWEGAFNDEVENSIILPEWFDAAVDLHKEEKFKHLFKGYAVKVAAHDPSDTGNDAKGYAMREGSIVRKVMEKKKCDIAEGCDWALFNARQDGVDHFVYDADGMGAGLKDQIARGFSGIKVDIHAYKGGLSGSAQDNAEEKWLDGDVSVADSFKNQRAQYSIRLANRFYNAYRLRVKGEYIDPENLISLDSEGIENMVSLKAESCRIPTVPNSSGAVQLMSKQNMKKNGINSPNMFDSVVMSFKTIASRHAIFTESVRAGGFSIY
jgi:phage terminase large subunit